MNVKLILSKSGLLKGVASSRFTGGGETQLDDIYVTGDRIEFKVRHRTGVDMRVTLALRNGKLKGEGIPIRSDEDRCDIVLTRAEKGNPPHGKPTAPDLANAATSGGDAVKYEGRWVGAVKDRPGKGDAHHSFIVDIAVNKKEGTLQIITMGSYQQAYDEDIDDAKVRDGKLIFQLVDSREDTATISLWSQPGDKDRLWGEAVPQKDPAAARDIELKRADTHEYDQSGEHRRLVLDEPDATTHSSFEPSGYNGDSNTWIAKSVVDHILRWLGLQLSEKASEDVAEESLSERKD
ncbi:MAG: hypothetical protein H8E44_41150 [Planctomycetes bacterium]|nr:hypothetical protein [Planctomycetota bacterium]